MQLRNGLISAVAGASLLGGAAVAALAAGGPGKTAPTTASLTAATATPPTSTTTAPATPAPATAAPSSPCSAAADDGGWPAGAQGEPAGFAAGDAAGVYVWHDASGWHLRVTHQNDRHQTYTGRISTAGVITDVDAVRLERNDDVRVGPDRHTVEFRFNNYGGVDGLDFRTHCADGLHFALGADGQRLNPTEVYIGHGSMNPPDVPFTISRTEG